MKSLNQEWDKILASQKSTCLDILTVWIQSREFFQVRQQCIQLLSKKEMSWSEITSLVTRLRDHDFSYPELLWPVIKAKMSELFLQEANISSHDAVLYTTFLFPNKVWEIKELHKHESYYQFLEPLKGFWRLDVI